MGLGKIINCIIKGKGNKEALPYAPLEFRKAMYFVRQTLRYEKEDRDKIIVLDYIMKVIKEDIKCDLLTTILYQPESFDKTISFPFPFWYYDEKGKKYNFEMLKNETRSVNLATDCVLVLAWDRERMRNSIKNIFLNNFTFIPSNHLAYYFDYVDICYAYNGTHSISAGLGHRQGTIEAEKFDVTLLFNHVYTDGCCWYSKHNGERLGELFDFRIGVIYEIARIKYGIEMGL